jgi:hypothetical protein
MNMFDVLSNNERVIVHSDKSTFQVYTWNRSCTLQCWDVDENWHEIDVQTLSTPPKNFEEARLVAIAWYNSSV